MPDKQVLNTGTNIIKTPPDDLGIYTYYTPRLEDIFAFIADSVYSENGVSFIENEEGYTIVGYEDVSFFINEDGDFIVQSLDPDRFAINSDGQLTITE